jgi:hypothetical protein
VLDKTPCYATKLSRQYVGGILSRKTLSFICFERHERNRHGYRMIAFTTLNVIHKRVITKVMVEYSESTL